MDHENSAPGNSGPDQEVVSTDDIEELIIQLPGIVSARVVVDDWGAIQEVHVLATSERGPKQLVRDVESTLAARWGITIDHKKISVAQLTGIDEYSGEARLQLTGVSVQNNIREAQTTVEVELAAPTSDRAFVGKQAGPDSRSQLVRTAAVAAVQAINSAVEHQCRVNLEEAEVVRLHTHEAAVVVVALKADGSLQKLVGSALTTHDIVDAVVRACLDAINRRLSRFIAQ